MESHEAGKKRDYQRPSVRNLRQSDLSAYALTVEKVMPFAWLAAAQELLDEAGLMLVASPFDDSYEVKPDTWATRSHPFGPTPMDEE